METKAFYSLIKEYQEARVDTVFSENDLFVVELDDKIPAYVSVVGDGLALYLGQKGITGYLRLCFLDPDATALGKNEIENSQECFILTMNNAKEELEPEDLKAIEESGVEFAEGFYPMLRVKRQYRFPWFLNDEEQQSFALALRGILFAKTYVAQFGKVSKTNSLTPWLESLGLDDIEKREYYPYLKQMEDEKESFTVEARELSDDDYGVKYPQTRLTNEEMLTRYKRMKAKPGKILYVATFLLPEPFKDAKGGLPVFPVAYMLFDPQKHVMLDLHMVDDYELHHTKFVSRLLESFDQIGKPQAIHCFGDRTYPLLAHLGDQINIMMVRGKQNDELDAIIEEFLSHGLEEDEHEHEHEHVHGPGCDHHHE
ncbi:MAG TPA: hypothetical protein VJ854_07460 [Sphaerochaeta sp.]|nr:hypothetical protein [Sphaerochaeta sp.]